MPTPRVKHLIAMIILTGAACVPARPLVETRPAPAARSPLTGTWMLTAADEIQPGGARVQSYGADPKGLLIVDADGRYSLQLYRAGRRTFAAGDKRRGTPEEFMDSVLGMSAHFGRCFIDPISGDLVFRIELAQYPNWEGTEQRRSYTLSGDTLKYRIPASASGNGTIPISEWRRVR